MLSLKKVVFENVALDLCSLDNVKIKDCVFKNVSINNSAISEKVMKELRKQDVRFENM